MNNKKEEGTVDKNKEEGTVDKKKKSPVDRKNAFGKMSTIIETDTESPIVGERQLMEDRQKQTLSTSKMVDTNVGDQLPSNTAAPQVPTQIAIEFIRTARMASYQDELLNIYFALNRQDYKSKSHVLYEIIKEFFDKKENRKYVDLYNNK